jgi:hypothetical protein
LIYIKYIIIIYLKGTTLTRYYDRNEVIENTRDRYIFVPKFDPRGDPTYTPNEDLEMFKQVRLISSNKKQISYEFHLKNLIYFRLLVIKVNIH